MGATEAISIVRPNSVVFIVFIDLTLSSPATDVRMKAAESSKYFLRPIQYTIPPV